MIMSNCLLHIPFNSPQIISSSTRPKQNSHLHSSAASPYSVSQLTGTTVHPGSWVVPLPPSPGIQSVTQPSHIHPVLRIPTDADLILAGFCFLFFKFHVGKGCQQTPN